MMDSEDELALSLKIISDEYKKIFDEEDIIPYECSQKECRIIQFLGLGKKTMSEISSELKLSPASATGYIDRLIDYKLIIRENDLEDRRKIFIELSNRGKEIVQKVYQKHKNISQKLLKQLSSEEKKIYIELNKKIAKGLQKKDEK